MLKWLGLLTCAAAIHSSSQSDAKLLYDDSLFFNRGVTDFETHLTPEDFAMGSKVADSMQFASGDIWDSDAMYGKNRFEGDIANDNLNASTVEMFLNGGNKGDEDGKYYNAIKNRHQLWPNGRIPYTISSQYSTYSRSLIAASMQEYASHTCIKWVPKESNDVNYVYIYPDRGCYSMVGKMGGKQSLSLGSGCIQKGIIIHELMHAVGFFHEQSRTDRDDYITIMWNNIQPGMQGQFEKYGQGTISALGTTYDYSSIMHYGGKAFSRNGQPTMVPKQKGAQIGQRGGFSKTDSFKINTLYGCSVDGTTPKTTQGTTTTVAPTTSKIYPPMPTLPSPKPVNPNSKCKNLRGDCDDLAKQGWCLRNPPWMKEHCPVSCGMCGGIKPVPTSPPTTTPTTTTTARPTTTTIRTTTTQPLPPPPPPAPPGTCEDLRVDCLVLVQQRYCKTSQNFMKTYCAKSCGFCFKPPPTEVPDVVTLSPIVPTMVTDSPRVTLFPTPPSPSLPATPGPEITGGSGNICKDKKHFCSHWKSAGFCEGIFMNYMKKNCPASCNHC